MEAPSKRTIGDVKDEKDPVRVAREARWRVKNTGLGGLRWGGGDDLEWSLETTRDKIFEEIKALAGVTALNPQKMTLAERDARSKVYADMYANGCGSSDAAASAVNVEYYIDVQLWKDHVQSVTHEEFRWKRPELFQPDEGYADFVRSKAPVNEPMLVIRPQPSAAETEQGEARSSTTDVPETEAARPQAEGKDKTAKWSAEDMTMIFDEMFGEDARFEGMGGFDLPMENFVAEVASPLALQKASTLLPDSVEIRPVNLGWGRFKLCLRFSSSVERGRDDFQVHLYHLAWTWCLFVQWKEKLLREGDREGLPSMYSGLHAVIEEWTKQAKGKLAGLSLCSRFWSHGVRADMADLEDEEAKGRLLGAVSEQLASSRGQDDEARACSIVDWAGSEAKSLGGGGRSRTYLAIEAMRRYCELADGEEKLGIIAQKMKPDQMHVAPSMLKKRAARASESN